MSIALKGLDVSEIVNLIILSGRGYSAKLLKFFKWYCQVMPVFIMVFHIACMYVFAQHSKEMGKWYEENMLCYAFIYFAVYIHPMIIIPASRFFWLCYRYRIPPIHLLLGSERRTYSIWEHLHDKRNDTAYVVYLGAHHLVLHIRLC